MPEILSLLTQPTGVPNGASGQIVRLAAKSARKAFSNNDVENHRQTQKFRDAPLT